MRVESIPDEDGFDVQREVHRTEARRAASVRLGSGPGM